MQELNHKYLIFNVDDETYGVPISKVQEVIQYVPITLLHETSSFLKGVINLRGKILPVMDMRLKLGMPEKSYDERTVFIIVEITGAKELYQVGLIVDSVSDVVEINDEQIEQTPKVGFKFKSHYLYGIAQINEVMVMILNMDTILSTDEVVTLTKEIEKA